MTPASSIRDRAAQLVRAFASERQALRTDLAGATRARDAAIVAAIEGLELLRGLADAGAPADDTLATTWRAVRERLGQAGIVLDGEEGEAVDLGRHRVLQERTAPGREGRVLAVVSLGIVVDGRRVREAVVVTGAAGG
jgi:hypothetical protein